MKITEQDKRDIKETIIYLNECAEYISYIKDAMDGEPTWKPNVIDSLDTAVIWLERLRGEKNEK